MKISELNTINNINADTKILVSTPVTINKNYATTLLTYNTLSSNINNNVTDKIQMLTSIEAYVDYIKNLSILNQNIQILSSQFKILQQNIDKLNLESLSDNTIAEYINTAINDTQISIHNDITSLNSDLTTYTENFNLCCNKLDEYIKSIDLSVLELQLSNIQPLFNTVSTISSNLYNGWQYDYNNETNEIISGSTNLSLYQLYNKASYIYDFLESDINDTDDSDTDDNISSLSGYLQNAISASITNIANNILSILDFTSASININPNARKQIKINLNTNTTFNKTFSPIYIQHIDVNPDTNIAIIGAYINTTDNTAEIVIQNTNTSKTISCTLNINVLYAAI